MANRSDVAAEPLSQLSRKARRAARLCRTAGWDKGHELDDALLALADLCDEIDRLYGGRREPLRTTGATTLEGRWARG